MKIYYNSKIAKLFTFIDGYKTIMLFGAVFTERDSISLRTEYHEEAHCNQYHTLFYFGMFISLLTIGLCLLFGNAGWWMLWLSLIPIFLYYTWYLIEYLIRLCIYRDHDKAYHNIVFEREAFDLEKYWNKHDVLRKESEGFSFLGYYRRSIIMSRRRYFEEQRSGNGAIYHCVETEIEPGDRIRLFNLMNKIKSDTISQDKINSVLNQLREGTAFNIHTQSPVSFSFSSTSAGHEPMVIWIRFDHYPAPSEQQGIIYKFQINDQRYVFMFSNRYNGMRDLINNADEDVDCVTSATEKSSIYCNNSFYIFV